MTIDPENIAAEMREAAEAFQHRPQSMRDRAFVESLNAFQTAANPANVLAILDERDAFRAELAEAREAFTVIYMQGHAKGVDAARAERDALKAEIGEQARLNGMGTERELALQARIVALEKAALRARYRKEVLAVPILPTLSADK